MMEWTESEVASMRRMADRGATREEAAIQLQRSYNSIVSKSAKLRIEFANIPRSGRPLLEPFYQAADAAALKSLRAHVRMLNAGRDQARAA